MPVCAKRDPKAIITFVPGIYVKISFVYFLGIFILNVCLPVC